MVLPKSVLGHSEQELGLLAKVMERRVPLLLQGQPQEPGRQREQEPGRQREQGPGHQREQEPGHQREHHQERGGDWVQLLLEELLLEELLLEELLLLE